MMTTKSEASERMHQLVVSFVGTTHVAMFVRLQFPQFKKFKIKNATVYDPTATLLPGTVYLCSETLAGMSRTITSVAGSSSGQPIVAALNYVPLTGSSYFCVTDDDDDGGWTLTNCEEPLRYVDIYLLDRSLVRPDYIVPVVGLSVNVTIAFI